MAALERQQLAVAPVQLAYGAGVALAQAELEVLAEPRVAAHLDAVGRERDRQVMSAQAGQDLARPVEPERFRARRADLGQHRRVDQEPLLARR